MLECFGFGRIVIMCILKGKKFNVEKVYFLNMSNFIKIMFCFFCYKVDNYFD